jgi:hypothetical protein
LFIVPQNTGPERHMKDDCHAFADIVDETARQAPTVDGFIHGLQQRLQARAGTPEYDEFRAGGFKQQFHDDNGSYNQVRQFVGTLSGGFFVGVVALVATPVQSLLAPKAVARAAVAAANVGETSAADRALNQHSVRSGVYLALGRLDQSQLGKYIRDNICESSR